MICTGFYPSVNTVNHLQIRVAPVCRLERDSPGDSESVNQREQTNSSGMSHPIYSERGFHELLCFNNENPLFAL